MNDQMNRIGHQIHDLAKRLWPLNRSITGDGVRKTLLILKELLPELRVHEVQSGTPAFDWAVPDEWNVTEAWIEGPDGRRFADFGQNNLHLMGYSVPIDARISLEELQPHLYSLPDQPDAIPYITSYYKRQWGFCLRHVDRQQLRPGTYRVHIDSRLAPGSLTYGELILRGESDKEIFLSTYICHPSMANNELSGPCVTTYLARWIHEMGIHRHTFRIVFIPETIGSIVYLSRHLEHLKEHVIAGFNVNCIGDDRCYSYLPSRNGNTLADKAAKHVLTHLAPDHRRYSYLDRGSDERQYCAPGVDLPIASIMRSKFGEYPEYHTSLDNLEFISATGLEGGFVAIQKAIEAIEYNLRPKITVLGEPQLSKRGLYPSVSTKTSGDEVRILMDMIAYCDGSLTLLDIAEIVHVPIWELYPICRVLIDCGLLQMLDQHGNEVTDARLGKT